LNYKLTVEENIKNIFFLRKFVLKKIVLSVNFCVIAHELGLAGAGETIEEQENFCPSVEMSSV